MEDLEDFKKKTSITDGIIPIFVNDTKPLFDRIEKLNEDIIKTLNKKKRSRRNSCGYRH